jgi:hypothetical protein
MNLFDQDRRDANRELVRSLSEWVEAHPDMRFGQILRNAGVVKELPLPRGLAGVVWADEFNLEPTELLKRVRKP